MPLSACQNASTDMDNSQGSAKMGMMSRNATPFFGKSGTILKDASSFLMRYSCEIIMILSDYHCDFIVKSQQKDYQITQSHYQISMLIFINQQYLNMQKYQIIEKAGDGNFSIVYKAIDLKTQQIVAIKDMKKVEQVEELIWRQLNILSTVKHPNIIKAKEIIQNGSDIKVVFEYISQNLLELYQNAKKGVSQNQIRCILYQTAFALDYLHSVKKIIHRDIKPQNILIDKKQAIVKLIDFGLAKQEQRASTDYVATRWYRAPQNLVGLSKSTTAIDIFALGCVIFELATLNPLFPGENTVDQLAKVFNILGSPTEETWLKGYNELKRKGVGVLQRQKVHLRYLMPHCSDELIDLLDKMLELDPEKRLKARQIMQHPFFERVERVIPTVIYLESKKYLQQIQKTKMNSKYEPNHMRDVSPNFRINPNDHNRQSSNQVHSQPFKINSPLFKPRATCVPNFKETNRTNKSIEPHVPHNVSPVFQKSMYPQQIGGTHNTLIKNTSDERFVGLPHYIENKGQKSYRQMDSFGNGNRVIMKNTISPNIPSPVNSVRNNFIKRIGF